MAKLIKIFAASMGGGLVLGAGIRLGEAIASQYPGARLDAGNKLSERLGELENRLRNLEHESPATVVSRFDSQAAAVSEVRTQLETDSRQIDELGATSLRLRDELKIWLDENVAARMYEVETRLKADSERGQKQILDAFTESVQTRVIHRISKLEDEVAGQSAAMTELRECSLRTEQSIQKLLGGLDRLLIKNPPLPEEAGSPSTTDDGGNTAPETTMVESVPSPVADEAPAIDPEASSLEPPAVEPPAVEPAAVEPPAFEPRPRSRRWKIFG